MQNNNHREISSRSDTPKLPISYNAYMNDLTIAKARKVEKFANDNEIKVVITQIRISKLPYIDEIGLIDLTASEVRKVERFAIKNQIDLLITRGIKKPLPIKKAADLYVSTPQTREYAKLHRPDANIAEKPKHKTAMTCLAGEAPPAGKEKGKCIAFPCQDSICRMFNCKG